MLTQKGKVGITDDAFEDMAAKVESRENSRANTPTVSKGAARMAARMAARTPGKGSPGGSGSNTPDVSAPNTPAVSGDEASKDAGPKIAKKKLTRKQVKDREERRRLRTVAWLSTSDGRPREPDTGESILHSFDRSDFLI